MSRLQYEELQNIKCSCHRIESNLNKTIEVYKQQQNFTNNINCILYLNDRIEICKDILKRNDKVRNSLDNKLKSLEQKDCRHNIIDDYIDIDTCKGQNIRYCDICFQTF